MSGTGADAQITPTSLVRASDSSSRTATRFHNVSLPNHTPRTDTQRIGILIYYDNRSILVIIAAISLLLWSGAAVPPLLLFSCGASSLSPYAGSAAFSLFLRRGAAFLPLPVGCCFHPFSFWVVLLSFLLLCSGAVPAFLPISVQHSGSTK